MSKNKFVISGKIAGQELRFCFFDMDKEKSPYKDAYGEPKTGQEMTVEKFMELRKIAGIENLKVILEKVEEIDQTESFIKLSYHEF